MGASIVVVVVREPELAGAFAAATTTVEGAGTPTSADVSVVRSREELVDRLRADGGIEGVVVEVGVEGSGWDAVRASEVLAPQAAVVVVADALDARVVDEAGRGGVSAIADADVPPRTVLDLARRGRGPLVVEAGAALRLAGARRDRGVRVAPGAPVLTRREQEVLEMLGTGLDVATIAQRLGVSVHTARGHVKKVMAKLHAHSQLQAVLVATEIGLLPPSPSSRGEV